MKLYHFPSPNPQKIHFALLELGLECEIIPVDLTKGEHRKPEFLALNPYGRVPVLIDGDLTLWESHAILAYLGEKAGKMWPTSAAGRADALRWLFFLSGHVTPPAGELARNRIAVKVIGGKIINITEKAGFSFEEFPKVRAYMDAIRSRPTWQKTPVI
jgi:glutathione S-transferase